MNTTEGTETTLAQASPCSEHPPDSGFFSRIRRWAFSPTPPGSRCVHFFRVSLRIVLIMWEEFFRTHLAIRASALTFAILLSLVPILALSTSILKGLGNDEHLKQAAIRFIDQLEAPVLPGDAASSVNFSQPATPIGQSDSVPTPVPSTTAHLHRAIDIIFQYVDRTNFAALGIFGVLGLIIVILLVLSSIEEAMNVIWHTRQGRSFLRKIMDYMALLILLPLSLNVALAGEAILASRHIMDMLSALLPTAWMLTLFVKLVPFLCIVVTLTTMYLFFPHVKVKPSAALAGAIFASIFWFVFQKLYVVLQVGVANYNAIYGSFASIPLFLIWLQIGWTFILLGASLAYAMQHHQHYHHSKGTLSPQTYLQIAFDVLRVVYDNFERRLPTTLALLCKQLPQVRCTDVQQIVTLLVQGHLLAGGDNNPGEERLVPVTPADRLPASEVVWLILGGEGHQPTEYPTARVVAAAAEAMESTFLKRNSSSNDHETTTAPIHPSNSWQQ
jgi:membrane protein